MNNYFQIINENTLHLSSGTPSNKIPKVGDLIFYNSNIASTGIFVGKVKSVNGNTKSGVNATVVETEIPSFEEIFSKLSLEVQMDSSNTIAIFDDEGSDEIVSCTVVGNSVWNSIETVYYDKNSGDTLIDSNLHNTKANPVPVDITLKIGVNSKYFEGNVYFNIKGRIYFEHLNGISNFAMELNKRIGLEGSLGFKIEGGKKIELDILPKILAKGITLYNNKMVGVRIVPHINLFADGAIKVETALNYEFVNSDVKSIYNNGNFTSSHVEQLHDNYFRLHSLHTEGSFGLACTGNLYIFLFSDNFFQGGFKLSAGLAIQGENNQGIQFPGLANFDFEVIATPFVECSPFVAFREKKGLKKIEGQPLVSANLAPFPILLLPNIHEMNYEKRNNNKKLAVKGNIVGQNTSLICSRQEGVALFEKGEDNPVQVSPVQKGTKAPTGEMLFNISNDKSYEISPYVVTVDNVVVFGKRMPIDNDEIDDDEIRSVLETLYYQTNGDNWTNNDNWCTDKPLGAWYGIKQYNGGYNINLADNNLCGYIKIANTDEIASLNVSGNQISSIEIEGLSSLSSLICDNNNLSSLNISECLSLSRLKCDNNNLSELDISQCPSLIYLNCNNNAISELYVPNSINLLDCSYNQIETMDLSEFNLLRSLDCSVNPIEILLANNLEYLEAVRVDECKSLNYVDLSGCISLRSFILDGEYVDYLSLSGCEQLNYLNLYNSKQITSLDVSGCLSLSYLLCYGKELSSLNVSGCSALEFLSCGGNRLKDLNLSHCSSLKELRCHTNDLSTLDISQCSSLSKLICSYNKLEFLDVSKCTSLDTLECNNNNLTSLTLTSSLKSVYCSNNKLSSLSIPEGIVALSCYDNYLTTIEIPIKIKYLNCSNNKLTSLDLSNRDCLETLYCVNEELEMLNLSNCKSLERLWYSPVNEEARYTKLKSLDLTGCINISYLFLNANGELKELKLNDCSSLEELYCVNTLILREIIDFFSNLKEFHYSQRYLYHYLHDDNGELTLTYEDRGYGWWYPGEPERGYHRDKRN